MVIFKIIGSALYLVVTKKDEVLRFPDNDDIVIFLCCFVGVRRRGQRAPEDKSVPYGSE